MNTNHNNQRSRGRGSNNKSGQRNRNSGSNNSGGNRDARGANGQNRNPSQIKQMFDKYTSQAREMSQSGDRIAAEGLLQYAEHYQRMLNEITAEASNRRPKNVHSENKTTENSDNEGNEGNERQDGQPSGENDKPVEVRKPRPRKPRPVESDETQTKMPLENAPEAELVEKKPRPRAKKVTATKTEAAE